MKLLKTRLTIAVNVETAESNELHLDIKNSASGLETITPVVDNGRAVHSLLVDAGTTVEIRPRSAQLYVMPFDQVVTVPAVIESCLPDIRFDALAGLFVHGSTDPPVEGAKVDLVQFNQEKVLESSVSDKNGAFTFGPLNPHSQYDVKLAHADYRFQQRTADQGNFIFNAFELANVDIIITDDAGNALSDVVVVLSGPG